MNKIYNLYKDIIQSEIKIPDRLSVFFCTCSLLSDGEEINLKVEDSILFYELLFNVIFHWPLVMTWKINETMGSLLYFFADFFATWNIGGAKELVVLL